MVRGPHSFCGSSVACLKFQKRSSMTGVRSKSGKTNTGESGTSITQAVQALREPHSWRLWMYGLRSQQVRGQLTLLLGTVETLESLPDAQGWDLQLIMEAMAGEPIAMLSSTSDWRCTSAPNILVFTHLDSHPLRYTHSDVPTPMYPLRCTHSNVPTPMYSLRCTHSDVDARPTASPICDSVGPKTAVHGS